MVFVSLSVHVHIRMGSHNTITYGKIIKVFWDTSTTGECMGGKNRASRGSGMDSVRGPPANGRFVNVPLLRTWVSWG